MLVDHLAMGKAQQTVLPRPGRKRRARGNVGNLTGNWLALCHTVGTVCSLDVYKCRINRLILVHVLFTPIA